MNNHIRISIRNDIELIPEGQSDIHIKAPNFEFNFESLSPGTINAIMKLKEEGGTEDELQDIVLNTDGFDGLLQFSHFLKSIERLGFVCYTISSNDQAGGAALIPLSSNFVFEISPIVTEDYYVLSPYCYTRIETGRLVLETPLSPSRLELTDQTLIPLIYSFLTPVKYSEVIPNFKNIDIEIIKAFISFLLQTKFLNRTEMSQTVENISIIDQWEFHDLLFHTRSRMGRHNNPYGGTYRFKDKVDQLPAVRPEFTGDSIALKRPNPPSSSTNDKSFAKVMEDRKSIRNYGESPINLDELSEFLYRVARIKYVTTTIDGVEICGKPYPAGGSINELEIYAVVNNCNGIKPGVYHYAAAAHKLFHLSEKNPLVDQLIHLTWLTASRQSKIQVLFVITARFQRLSLKYQSVSYSLILKHVGVLFQTMYLVATEMGLAPCAIGGGDADLFAKITGLNYYLESSVGEFLLGSCP